MVVEKIREFNRAVPFKPYEIRTVKGKCYPVKHPDFVCIAPHGSFVIVYGKNDRPHQISESLIESAFLLKMRQRKQRRRHVQEALILLIEIPREIFSNFH